MGLHYTAGSWTVKPAFIDRDIGVMNAYTGFVMGGHSDGGTKIIPDGVLFCLAFSLFIC